MRGRLQRKEPSHLLVSKNATRRGRGISEVGEWLRRGIEVAIGFDFVTDFLRHVVAHSAAVGAVAV